MAKGEGGSYARPMMRQPQFRPAAARPMAGAQPTAGFGAVPYGTPLPARSQSGGLMGTEIGTKTPIAGPGQLTGFGSVPAGTPLPPRSPTGGLMGTEIGTKTPVPMPPGFGAPQPDAGGFIGAPGTKTPMMPPPGFGPQGLSPVQPGGSQTVYNPNAPAPRFEQFNAGRSWNPNAPAQRFEQTRTPLNRNQRTARVLGGGTL